VSVMLNARAAVQRWCNIVVIMMAGSASGYACDRSGLGLRVEPNVCGRSAFFWLWQAGGVRFGLQGKPYVCGRSVVWL